MHQERETFGAGGEVEARAFHRLTAERVIEQMRRGDGVLSLGDMADIACLSPYHFARTFRRVTGVSPGEFQTAVRLERAKRLLLTTDLSVGEVCFEVGYESLGSFTTRFTRLVGVSPGRMRRLPEAAVPAGAPDRPPAPEGSAGVAFRIVGPEVAVGTRIFAGLFPGAIPQGRPVAGAALSAPGVHKLAPVPDGVYQLMAAAIPCSGDLVKFLLPGDSLRVGRGEQPVVVRGGSSEGVVDVALRPLRATDPPLLVALAGGALSGASPRRKAR